MGLEISFIELFTRTSPTSCDKEALKSLNGESSEHIVPTPETTTAYKGMSEFYLGRGNKSVFLPHHVYIVSLTNQVSNKNMYVLHTHTHTHIVMTVIKAHNCF